MKRPPRMKSSPFYDRLVDVMEELMNFTYLVRGRADYLLDRYSERKGAAEALALAAASGAASPSPTKACPWKRPSITTPTVAPRATPWRCFGTSASSPR